MFGEVVRGVFGFGHDSSAAGDDFGDHGIRPAGAEQPADFLRIVRFELFLAEPDQEKIVPPGFVDHLPEIRLLEVGKLKIQQKNGDDNDSADQRRDEEQNGVLSRHRSLSGRFVTDAADGFDPVRPLPELFPQVDDMHVDGPRRDGVVVPLDLPDDLIPGEYPAGI